jgi:hypothetical protein
LPLFELVFYCIGMAVMTDPDYGEVDLAAELDARAAAGALLPPMDVEARDLSDGPMEISEMDFYDTASHRLSEVDALEWELFAAIDHDEAERFLLEDKAPPWMTLPPGGELATALERLRPTVESPIALVEVMKASGRLVAWAESIKIAAMASFYRQREAQAADIPRPVTDERGRPADPLRSAAAEIGAALRLAPSTTDSHISNALRLTSVLPMTYGALRCGAISLSKALTIAEATAHLPLEAQHDVEEKVLPRAPEQTQGALKAALRRAVARVDARREGKRHKDAVKERQCRLVPLADGMAGLWLTHTADKIRTLFAAIQALAAAAKTPPADESDESGAAVDNTGEGPDHGPVSEPDNGGPDGGDAVDRTSPEPDSTPDPERDSDPGPAQGSGPAQEPGPAQDRDRRTAEQRRADVDVFARILENGLDWLGRKLPDQHRRRPHIEVLVPITTLLGMDDYPCELTGYGPIPAERRVPSPPMALGDAS